MSSERKRISLRKRLGFVFLSLTLYSVLFIFVSTYNVRCWNGVQERSRRGWRSEVSYKGGRQHGKTMVWDNGQLHHESNYKSGKRHGICRDWNGEGKLTGESVWSMGQRVNEIHYLRQGDEIRVFEAEFLNGNVWDGQIIRYDNGIVVLTYEGGVKVDEESLWSR